MKQARTVSCGNLRRHALLTLSRCFCWLVLLALATIAHRSFYAAHVAETTEERIASSSHRRSGNGNSVESIRLIPPILHQTWISDIIPSSYAPYVRSWVGHRPRLDYYYWTDASSLRFVARHYPEILDTFRRYPAHLNRADAVRYMLLHRYGGIYADMDMMRLRDLAPLLNSNKELCYVSQERYEITRLYWGYNSFAAGTQEVFKAHMATHYEFQCPACDYKSRTDGRLKRHLKDFHSEVPPESYSGKAAPSRQKLHRCRQCSFVTDDRPEFWQHSRGHIKSERLLECPSCPFVTEYKHHLEYHIRNHLGSKPFKCPKCNYQCVNRSMLNSHLKSHTNVYQYRCLHCSYATKYCHSLKQHLRRFGHRPAAVLNADGSLPKAGAQSTTTTRKMQPPPPPPPPPLPPPPLLRPPAPLPPPPPLPPLSFLGHMLPLQVPLDLTAKPGGAAAAAQQPLPIVQRCECHFCGIAFKEPLMFDLHMGYHGFENPFKCNRCGCEARDRLDFFVHLVSSAHC